MIKKVVIAAAGEGTRMLHLTQGKPKHLINIKKRPFLAYLLDNLFLAGYRDLIFVVGYKEEMIDEFLRKYKPPLKSLKQKDYRIRQVSQYELLGPKSKIYGTACPLMCVKDIVGKSSFVYVVGDNLFSPKDLKEISINGKYNYVAGIYNKHPEKYGVLVVTPDGFLKEIVEKPKHYVGNLINTGLYKFTPEVFEKLSKIKKSPRGEYEITDLINLLAKEKKVKVKRIKDYWLDFGNPADVIKVSKFVKWIKKFSKIKNVFLPPFSPRGYEVVSARARDVVERASEFISRGQIIVCPTDTVYGILGDATKEEVVKKVFKVKNRDLKKPFPIFVKDINMAKELALIDKNMEAFLEEIWPGKLTIVLKRKKRCGLPKILFGRKTTIALRIPDYKLVGEILKKVRKPLIGTSANISGKPSSTKFKEVVEQFQTQEIKPDLFIDAGNLPNSRPSTIVDFTKGIPKVIKREK